jgi:hypothetical protein
MPYNIYLKIFVSPNADISNNRIYRFWEAANNFWSREGIRVQVYWHGPYQDNRYYWWVYTNETYDSTALICPQQNSTTDSLFRYNTDNRYISVYFIGGNTFANSNGFTTGCEYASFRTTNGVTTIADRIIIANGATPIVFAHEIGHALFTRVEGGTITNTNPGSENLPDKSHSNLPNNLMLPSVPANPSPLTAEQRQKALQSRLVYFTSS